MYPRQSQTEHLDGKLDHTRRQAGSECRGRAARTACTAQRVGFGESRRTGYTLLELMIALGLLGALMSVAWSLMATFQIAEQRGWKLTQRTQIIRAAHDWLQSDAHQVITQSPELKFTGSTLGFTTLIAPSIDPLPFLERLMSDSTADDEFDSLATSATSATSAASSSLSSTTGLSGSQSGMSGSPLDPETAELLADDTPWNKARLEIEYQLLPMPTDAPTNSATPQASAESGSADDMQFVLVRRELVSGSTTGPSGSMQDDPQAVPANERVLTGQDLYRQTDEQQFSSSGIAINESRLEGLVRPQFQYSDGRSWRSSWNSHAAGSLPVAVALRFDFPARAQMQPRPPGRSSDSLDAESALGSTDASAMSAADMALAGEAQAELETDDDASLMESEEFEVQMVILFHRQPIAATRTTPAGGNSLGTGNLDNSLNYDADFPLGNPAGAGAVDVGLRPEVDGPGVPSGRSDSESLNSRQGQQGNREQREGF